MTSRVFLASLFHHDLRARPELCHLVDWQHGRGPRLLVVWNCSPLRIASIALRLGNSPPTSEYERACEENASSQMKRRPCRAVPRVRRQLQCEEGCRISGPRMVVQYEVRAAAFAEPAATSHLFPPHSPS
jgi:hypothetical protein